MNDRNRLPPGWIAPLPPPKIVGPTILYEPKAPITQFQAAQCIGKLRHESRHDAMVEVRRKKKRTTLNAYKCQHCGGWHIGKKKYHPKPEYPTGEDHEIHSTTA